MSRIVMNIRVVALALLSVLARAGAGRRRRRDRLESHRRARRRRALAARSRSRGRRPWCRSRCTTRSTRSIRATTATPAWGWPIPARRRTRPSRRPRGRRCWDCWRRCRVLRRSRPRSTPSRLPTWRPSVRDRTTSSTQAGIDVGNDAAAAILALRVGDGSDAPNPPFTLPPGLGVYQPTPNPEFPAVIIPFGAAWAHVTPFVLNHGRQFEVEPGAIFDLAGAAVCPRVQRGQAGRQRARARPAAQLRGERHRAVLARRRLELEPDDPRDREHAGGSTAGSTHACSRC